MQRFSRKQAAFLYSAFNRGMLRSHFPNKSWVYGYARPTESETVLKEQIALANAVTICFSGNYSKAQKLLDEVFGKYPVLD